MPRFKHGDRVQLMGDIARFYTCIVGVIMSEGTYPASILNQYKVHLADGIQNTFFDFQLHTPAAIMGRLILDTSISPNPAGTRGQCSDRNVHLVGRDIDIHLKITGPAAKMILGQVTAGRKAMRHALVSLLIEGQESDPVATDTSGEFTLQDVPPGDLRLEVFIPECRILTSLTI